MRWLFFVAVAITPLALVHCDGGDAATPTLEAEASILPPVEAGAAAEAEASTIALCNYVGVDASAEIDAGDAEAGPLPATFTTFNNLVIQKICNECHRGPIAPSGKLLMGDRCTAYQSLLDQPAQGPACGTSGQTRVVPGDPDASLLFHKVAGTQSCGGSMPLGEKPLSPELIQVIHDWIRNGAKYD